MGLELGDIVIDTLSCAYEDCTKKATHHILLSMSGSNTAACFRHYLLCLQVLGCVDVHPMAPDCAMPGTVWYTSTPEGPGRCVWDDDDTAIEVEQNDNLELVGV